MVVQSSILSAYPVSGNKIKTSDKRKKPVSVKLPIITTEE
jgi:hypothetical protein